MATPVQTPDTEALNESKTFICLNDNCAHGVVHVRAGKKAGEVIKHKCGTKATLTHADGVWGLATLEDIAPKKRGRPKKVAEPVDEAHEAMVKQILAEDELAAVEQVPTTDMEAAEASDARIEKALNRGGENFFIAVKELIESRNKGYYKLLGYSTFSAYREVKSQYSRSHLYQLMQAYESLHDRIPDDVLQKIPTPTAILLTRIPQSKLTAEVIESAQDMKIQDFKEQLYPQLVGQLVDAATGQPQPMPAEEWDWIPRMRVHKPVADRWKQVFELAKQQAAGIVDEHDVYGMFSLDEKAILAIYMECMSSWSEDEDMAQAQSASQSS